MYKNNHNIALKGENEGIGIQISRTEGVRR